ncbi:MAG: hypothetical protein ACHRHE_21680 [Tepidisphaerales bacterium]
MSIRFPLLWAMMVFMAASAIAAEGGAMRPAERPPFTNHDYYREALAFSRRTFGESYRAAGRRNPAWDQAAEETMELLARGFTAAIVGHRLYIPDGQDAGTDVLLPQAQKAIDLGCDDPMVIYAMAVGLNDKRQSPEAMDWLQKAFKAAQTCKYPPLRRLGVFARMRRASTDPAARTQAWSYEEPALRETLAGPFANTTERRIVFHIIDDDLNSLPPDTRPGCVSRLAKAKGTDPWIAAMLQAEQAKRMAWLNLPAFWVHMANARKYAAAAWEACPDAPEAATLLVIASASSREHATARDWFRKATAVQVDFGPAYDAIFWGLSPACGGSGEQVLELGIEAAQVQRYDLNVPMQFMNAVDTILREDRDGARPEQMWKQPQVRELAMEVMRGYAGARQGKPDAAYFQTTMAILEELGENHAAARQILDTLGEKLDAAAFQRFQTLKSTFVEGVYLRCSPQWPVIKEIFEGPDKKSGAMARRLTGVLAAMAADDPARESIEKLQRRAVAFSAYDNGEWVSLLSRKETPFWLTDSPIAVEEQAMIVGGDDKPFWAHMPGWFDDPGYEIDMKFEFVDPPAEKGAAFGICFGVGKDGLGYGVHLQPRADKSSLILQAPHTPQTVRPWTYAAKNDLHIVLWQGSATVEVNGQLIHVPVKTGAFPEERMAMTTLRIGSTYYGNPCAGVRITELKIRKLDKRPE